MSLPTFRPRSATELVDAAVQLGRRHYTPLVTLAVIVAVPSLCIGLLAQWLLPQQTITTELQPEAILALLPALLVGMCWFYVGLGALVASAAAAYVDGRALEPLDALRRALRRALALVVGNLAAAFLIVVMMTGAILLLGVTAGLIGAVIGMLGGSMGVLTSAAALIIGGATVGVVGVGGLLFSALFVNVTASVMLEGLGPLQSVARSMKLVRGGLLRVAGVVAIMIALYLAAYLTALALAAMVVDAQLASNVAGVFVVALYPFLSALLALLYYDLRIRREGYDLELIARALGEAPAGAAGDALPSEGAPA